MSDLSEQFEWWLRQECKHYAECPYASEVESFIYAVRKTLDQKDAEIETLKEKISTLECWKEGAELVIEDLGATYTGPTTHCAIEGE